MAEGKRDPIEEMAESAEHVHKVYAAYCLAGFTDQQALYLTGVVIGAAIRATVGAPGGEANG